MARTVLVTVTTSNVDTRMQQRTKQYLKDMATERESYITDRVVNRFNNKPNKLKESLR